MRKVDIFFFIINLMIFGVFLVIHESITQDSLYSKPEQRISFPIFTGPLSLFLFLYIAYIVYALLQSFNIYAPYGSPLILVSFFWGMMAYHSDEVYLASSFVTARNGKELMLIYTPVLVFHMSFCLDIPLFLKTIHQIMIIGFPVSLLAAAIHGMVSLFIINYQWKYVVGVLFGLFCSPISTQNINTILKEHSRTRQINVLLEGESIFSFITTDLVYRMMQGYFKDMVHFWYQFTCVWLRAVIIGLFTGLIMGYVFRLILRQVYTNKITTFLICLGAPFFTFTLSDIYLSGCGSISVFMVGAFLGQERTVWSKEVEQFLTDFWSMAGFALHVLVIFKGTVITVLYIIPSISWYNYPILVVCYMLYYIIRFFSYLIFSPALSRLGYGMTLADLIICVWCGLKTSFGFLIVMLYHEEVQKLPNEFMFYMMGMYFLSCLINGVSTIPLLDTIGLRRISIPRQANMNNCLKHIYDKRKRQIEVLKMTKILADVNWSTVVESTNLRHPYQIELEDEEGGDEEYMGGFRYTWCSECQKNVEQELSKKEKADILREAKMRVLKAKKMSYSRQYENGMISKEGIKILTQAVELALDSKDKTICISDLSKKFEQEGVFRRWVRSRIEKLKERSVRKQRRPKTYWRRVAYNFAIRSPIVAKIMWFIAVLHYTCIVANFVHYVVCNEELASKESLIALQVLENIFIVIFFLEFITKILGYSYNSVCLDGIPHYFKDFFNICDFIVLIACIVYTLYYWTLNLDLSSKIIVTILTVLRFIRGVRLFQAFVLFYSDIIYCLERRIDQQLASAYEIAKCYLIGQKEIQDKLGHLIHNVEIRQQISNAMEADRMYINKLIGTVHNERPWIAITVKTTQTVRTILNNISLSIQQLKTSGWIDYDEYNSLTTLQQSLYKKVNKIKKVMPSSPNALFKGVSWMADDESIIEFLYENIAVKKFEPGDVIFNEGMVADGIYVVVTGLFKIRYKPNRHILKSLYKYGQLPILDYLNVYEEAQEDYIVTGNCIGELSTLTERAFNCVITAEAYSQVYVLSNGILKRAMQISSDPVNGLECRIWKEVGLRLAIRLLPTLPTYSTYTTEQIKSTLERSFSPDLSNYKIFIISDLIEVVILLEGIVADYHTRKQFTAPCCLPLKVKKIILPKSSLLELPFEIETRLLIVPAKEADQYDVMFRAEEMGELVNTASMSKCLLHTVQEKIQKRRQKRTWESISFERSGSRIAAGSISGPSFMSQATVNTPAIDYSNRSELESMYNRTDSNQTITRNRSKTGHLSRFIK